MSVEIWFPVVTLVIGFILNSIFAHFTESNRWKRERKARLADFEGETVLELQNVVNELVRSMFRILVSDLRDIDNCRELGWGSGSIDPDLNDNVAADVRRARLLISRVSDVEVRELAEKILECYGLIVSAQTFVEADAATNRAATLAPQFLEISGRYFRQLTG
nr:hypothetical protein [uncultured Roseovarius sp.]